MELIVNGKKVELKVTFRGIRKISNFLGENNSEQASVEIMMAFLNDSVLIDSVFNFIKFFNIKGNLTDDDIDEWIQTVYEKENAEEFLNEIYGKMQEQLVKDGFTRTQTEKVLNESLKDENKDKLTDEQLNGIKEAKKIWETLKKQYLTHK